MTAKLGFVFIYGRLKDLSRDQVSASLTDRGGRLARSGSRADIVIMAHSAVDRCIVGSTFELPFEMAPSATLISEDTFRRTLLPSHAEPSLGPYSIDDVARLSQVPESACRVLALFDVIGEPAETYTYQDIATAKQVARLLKDGVDLKAIVSAGIALGRRGLRMAQTRLVTAPWGEIVQSVADRILQLNGQFALFLDEERASADQFFAEASEQEALGEHEQAVRLYDLAERLDKRDPAIPFNRGNVLVALARPAEAMIAFRQALDRDPQFAEAAFNLAHLFEAERRPGEAERFYRQALAVHPGYAAASYNLARILTDQQLFADAIPLWEAFLGAAPSDPDAERARRMLALCRMEVKARLS